MLAGRAAGSFVDGVSGPIAGDYSAASGDYLHKALPYNATGTTYPFDAPEREAEHGSSSRHRRAGSGMDAG